MRTGFATDPLFLEHDTGPGHPERADRLRAIADAVADLPLLGVEPRDATRDEIEAAHTHRHFDTIRTAPGEGLIRLDADTVVSPRSFDAAIRAAGTALALGEAFLAGKIDAGFAAIRPPGHHATADQAMGFCLFNNVAVLARMLQREGKSVAIVDWDVHHGNGTQDIFWKDAAIGYVSLHQFPFYPGSGAASERGASGNILNLPVAAGSGDDIYLELFDESVLPFLRERAPDVVLISAGFDAHERDPLAQVKVTTDGFAEMTRRLLEFPMLSVLEGGYDLQGLSSSVRAHLQVLADAD